MTLVFMIDIDQRSWKTYSCIPSIAICILEGSRERTDTPSSELVIHEALLKLQDLVWTISIIPTEI